MIKLKILFVCTGNICRSPLAEAVLVAYVNKHNLSANFEIDSCGTSAYHVESLPDERAVNAAQKQGIFINHKARQITAEDMVYYDYILVMDHLNYEDVVSNMDKTIARNKVFLLRSFDPSITVDYNVPDPYYGTQEDFDDVLTICENSIDGFINYLISENQIPI